MQPEFREWAARHARLFGIVAEAAVAMLMEWADLFSRLGLTPGELTEASDFIALNPPRFPSEHLGLIQHRIRDRRQLADALRRKQEEDRGRCEACDNTGWVQVPFEGLKTRGGAEYPAGTLGLVKCKCERGRFMKNQALSLEQYERSHPYWKDELDRLADLRQRQAKAQEQAGNIDKAVGDVLRRVQTQQKEAV